MTPEAVEQLLGLFTSLIAEHNKLSIKIGAAEAILHRQDPALFDEYMREKERLGSLSGQSMTALAIEGLRQKMLHG